MKPALGIVVSRLRAGGVPSVLEYGALLHENGCDQAEARALAIRYRDAIGERTVDARAEAVELLQSFRLRPG